MNRQPQRGFTLLELIIAIALTVALVAGLAAFLRETIATSAHLRPQNAWLQQLLFLNGELRHELAGASFRHIDLDNDDLVFESSAPYRALAPGRYFYHYTYDPSAETLSLTLHPALHNNGEGAVIFQGVVLKNVDNVRFAALFRPPQAAGPLPWVSRIRVRGPASLAMASTLVAVRVVIKAHPNYPRLPPLLYVLGTP